MWDGITWLDIIMAILTTIGLLATWLKARGAMTAAEQTKSAIAKTADRIGKADLIAQLGIARELAKDLDSAVQNNSVPVTSHVLVKLVRHLGDLAALSEKVGDDVVDSLVVGEMRQLISEAAAVKRKIGKTPNVKIVNHTSSLEDGLEVLQQRFSAIEIAFKYPEVQGEVE